MEMREKQDTFKRLMAYSAAAGLGAFGMAQTAQASPILPGPSTYTDIPDITLLEGGAHAVLDLNGDSIDDIDLYMKGQEVSWFLRFYADGINGSQEYSNLVKGNANYIRSFEDTDAIGPANLNCVVGALVSPIAQSNTTNFGKNNLQYMGIKLGTGEWGWIRMQYFRDGISAGVGYATVYDYAITPEPGSLALLAAGAGALGFRRRRA